MSVFALLQGVAIAGLGRKRNGRQYLSDKETAVNSPMPEGNVQRNGAYRVEHNEVLWVFGVVWRGDWLFYVKILSFSGSLLKCN